MRVNSSFFIVVWVLVVLNLSGVFLWLMVDVIEVLSVVDKFAFFEEVVETEVVEVFLGDEETVVQFVYRLEQGAELVFELVQFLVCEEVVWSCQLFQLLVEPFCLFGALLCLCFQFLALQVGKDSQYEEDDDGDDDDFCHLNVCFDDF